MDSLWLLLSVPILIATNAFFVASEYALVATRPVHIESLRSRGRVRVAVALERLKARAASTLGAIQICITVTNLALGWLGEPAMTALLTRALGPFAAAIPDAVFRPLSLTLSFLVVTLLTVVFSELLPKAMSLRYIEVAGLLTAVPVLAVARLVSPIVWLMNLMSNAVTVPLGLGRVQDMEDAAVSVDELRVLATRAAAEGVLTTDERTLVVNALALNERTAKQIMVPRVRVAYLDLTRSMEENRAVMNEHLFSRLPLCNGGLDRVVGLVHTKQFLTAYAADADVSCLQLIAEEAVFVPEFVTVGQLLKGFSERRTEFVFLADEYGGLSGVVTLKDVVDDLIGAVGEALDPPRLLTTAVDEPGRHVVRGDLPVHELARLLGEPDWGRGEDAATVAGVIQARLGGIGHPDDEVEVEGVRLRVLQSDGKAIGRVLAARTRDTAAATLTPA